MAPYSDRFEDVYFSAEDGLAETHHVFLEGNGLPNAWKDKDRFVIAETGFGTGLNFLATWTLFEDTAKPNGQLHYISIEKYPLTPGEIRSALSPWEQFFGHRLIKLCDLYPLRTPGFHRIRITPQVILTLIFDDVNNALPALELPRGADAWFLDGFKPSSNPDMWSGTVFEQMARLSQNGTRFATFTAAGDVRRGLESAGFSVEKQPGFGKKRDMLTGCFKTDESLLKKKKIPQKIAIIGGGLAGCAAAFVLKENGLDPVIFEAGETLAPGASGNAIGLYNPRLSAHRTPESDFYTAGFTQAVRTFRELQKTHDIKFKSCGSLHLFKDAEKEKRLRSASEHWCWNTDHMQIMSVVEGSEQTGLSVPCGGLFLPDAGVVSPSALCTAYTARTHMHLRTPVKTLEEMNDGWLVNGKPFHAVILACGAAVKTFSQTSWLPVHTVQGQITHLEASPQSEKLKINLCADGYISPAFEGIHTTGATFNRNRTDTSATSEDDQENIDRIKPFFPTVEGLKINDHRAALRTASKDRFPIAGSVPDKTAWDKGEEKNLDGLYVSTAHGSHGIIASLAAAHYLADLITQAPLSLPAPTTAILQPERFPRRARRKQKPSTQA